MGTNFDCEQPTFNLKGAIYANATFTLYGVTAPAFAAGASYASIGSDIVSNNYFFEAFGKTVVSEKISSVDLDCKKQSRPLGTFTAPGLSAYYVVCTYFSSYNSDLGRMHSRCVRCWRPPRS